MRSRVSGALALVLVFAAPPLAAQDTIRVATWNLESGGADELVLSDQLAAIEGIDVWGFSEVSPDAGPTLEVGAELGGAADFEWIMSRTGGGDRLMIAFDAELLELLDTMELDSINSPALNHRSPLVARFRIRDSGLVFLFVVNHFARRDARLRLEQANRFKAWVRAQTDPVVAVGDYNLDWVPPDGASRDAAFDELLGGDVLRWVRPADLVRTQCTVTPEGGCRFDSILDFVLLGGRASCWSGLSRILVRPGDFPHDETTSDHRPVVADLTARSCDEGASPIIR